MVFAGSGITYSELKEMDLRRVPGSRRGPLAVARRMEPQQKEIAVPSGAAISAFKEVKTWQTQETSPMA